MPDIQDRDTPAVASLQDLHRPGGHIDPNVPLEQVQRPFQVIGNPVVVWIEKGHLGVARFCESGVAGHTHALVHLMPDAAHRLRKYTRCKGPHDRVGTILGS